jgi:hypothetical protein
MGKPIKLYLNGKETTKLLELLKSLPEKDVPLEITATETGIGTHIEAKSGHCKDATDLTDYKSW